MHVARVKISQVALRARVFESAGAKQGYAENILSQWEAKIFEA